MNLTTLASIATIAATVIALVTFLQGRRKRDGKAPEKSGTITLAPAIQKSHPASQRMRQIIDLMNAGRRDLWTVAHFAERLKLKSPGELEQTLDSTIEPTFVLLEAFAALTGANAGWLKFGTQQPFYSGEHNDLYPDGCLPRIRELSPKQVFIVRCRDKAGRSGFLLRLDEFRFVVFTRTWHISSEVGGTGQGQLISFYRAMKTLSAGTGREYGYPCGQILDQIPFDRLLAGEVYPGSVIQPHNNPWWEDFLDLECKNFGAEYYGGRYGTEFLEAQKIVRWRLSQDSVVP